MSQPATLHGVLQALGRLRYRVIANLRTIVLGLRRDFAQIEPKSDLSLTLAQRPNICKLRPWRRAALSAALGTFAAGRPWAVMEDLPISADGPRTGSSRRDNLRARLAVMQKRDDRPASAALVSSAGLEYPLPPRTWTARA